jgi:hypothetical protein
MGRKSQKPPINEVNIIPRPQTSHSRPAKRWVRFQFSSLWSVQGILMPMV